MNRLSHRLLRWGLGDVEARVLLSELKESYDLTLEAEGKSAADRWMGKEVWRATLPAVSIGIRRTLRSGPPKEGSVRGVSTFGEAIGTVLRDIRFSLRALRKRPLFTAVVVGTLGLGIGASTTVFSLVDGVLLGKLPFEQPGELVTIWKSIPEWRGQVALGDEGGKIGPTWSDYLTLREASQLFREVAVRKNRTMILSGSGTAARLEVGETSSALFPMLGVRPLLGRVFLPGEEGPGSARLVVLDHSLWRSRFGSDPNIVGTTVHLDEEPFEVIGVLPLGFRLRSTFFNRRNAAVDTGERAAWIPIGFDGLEEGWSLETMARLMPGAKLDQAQAELVARFPEGQTADGPGFRLIPLKEEVVGDHRSSLLLLLTAAGLLLLIACANIAALLTSEAANRRQEMATRRALGAGRLRIARQLLTESLMIGVLGSLLGIALASGGIPAFLALAPPLPRLEEVGLNHGVLLFSALVGIGTGILFGLVPAFFLQEDGLRSVQMRGSRGNTGGWGGFQRGLVGGEIALTMVLLVTGGLFARSLLSLSQVDPGFDTESIATVQAHLPVSAMQDPGGIRELFTQVLERIENIPGVVEAGAVDGLPFPGRPSTTGIQIVGAYPDVGPMISTENHLLLPGYLETMGIPLLAGRTLTEADERTEGPRGMLINETMARQYWPNESPLGARIQQSRRDYEIVGIVGDVRERHLSEDPKATVYRVGPFFANRVSIVARVAGAPADVIPMMGEAIWSVNPEIPLSQQGTLRALVEDSTGNERYRTMLVTVFGLLAILVSSVGVFGVTAHSVSMRTREMGIRIALGARKQGVIGLILRDSLSSALVGGALGMVAAFWTADLIAHSFFGIETGDLATYSGALILLSFACFSAALIPAMRITRRSPSEIISEE